MDMTVIDPVTLLTACAAITAVWMVCKAFGSSSDKKYYPVKGTVVHMVLNFRRLHDYLTDLSRRDRSFRIVYPNNSQVFTIDPANIEHILKTNFPNYGKGSLHYDILKDLLGDGIFTVDGDKWRHQRKMSSYEFSTRNLKEFSSGVFKNTAAKLAHIVSEVVALNQTIEIQGMLMKSSLDSVFKVVLGVDLDSVHGVNEEGTQFSIAFEKASELSTYRYLDMFWRIKKVLDIGTEAELKKCVKVVDGFVYKVIRTKMDRARRPNEDTSVNKGDILSRFLVMNEMDPKYLKDIILSFIIAGKDTTAGTLSWFFYMMCKHPSYQEKIVKEVREATKIGIMNPTIDEIVESISEEALGEMQLLHAALSETLRLYPAVPWDGKMCFSDDTLPDGFSVKRGDLVSYVPYAMGRMKSLWGDDAEDFRPERWLDNDGVFQQESSFKFTAFQAGPRICLGKEFAYRQMKVFAAILLSTFSFELSDVKKPVRYRTMLTLLVDGGLHLRARRRTA